jgi:hypothetical protein
MIVLNTTSGSTVIQVTYNVASVPPGGLNTMFSLNTGDYITFTQNPYTLTNPAITTDQQIIGISGDHTFFISAPAGMTAGNVGTSFLSPAGSYLPLTGTPSVWGAAAPYGDSYWGQAIVKQSPKVAFTATLTDTINILGSAAVAVINAATPAIAAVAGDAANAAAATLNALTPALVSVTNTAANTAAGLVHALTPAIDNTLCDIFPLFCNSTLWWIVGGICACLIIVAIVLKFRK